VEQQQARYDKTEGAEHLKRLDELMSGGNHPAGRVNALSERVVLQTPMPTHPTARLTPVSRKRLIRQHLDKGTSLSQLLSKQGIRVRSARQWRLYKPWSPVNGEARTTPSVDP
jgi:hypothetical protein